MGTIAQLRYEIERAVHSQTVMTGLINMRSDGTEPDGKSKDEP